MLLLEESQGDIFIAYYDSSNILMSKYIYSAQKLSIIFSKGHQYIYDKVIPYHYQRFKISQSQGVGLKTYISNNYKGLKADVILTRDQIDQIKDEINKLQDKNKV